MKEGIMKKRSVSLATALIFAMVGCLAATAVAKDVPRMSVDELRGKLGSPDVVVIDVRTAGDWDSSDIKIEGAVREDSNKVQEWMGKYAKDRTLLFYCA